MCVLGFLGIVLFVFLLVQFQRFLKLVFMVVAVVVFFMSMSVSVVSGKQNSVQKQNR